MSRQAVLESELMAAVEEFLDDGLEPPSIEACEDLGFALSAVVDSALRADAGWVQEGMSPDGFSLAIALRDGNRVRVSGTLHEVRGGERVLVADLSRSGTFAIWISAAESRTSKTTDPHAAAYGTDHERWAQHFRLGVDSRR